MGCDVLAEATVGADGEVSIHAPTWGATHYLNNKPIRKMFQSTHPHGVRQKACRYESWQYKFQSTHPHGVRPHIQQKAEYHIAKVYNLRRKTKRIILKEIKAKK